MTTPRRRKARQPGDPATTISPSAAESAELTSGLSPTGDALETAILRYLRQWPNLTVELGPLAEQLGLDPFEMQLTIERLHARRKVVAPFIEPGTAGGATLTEVGLRWLIDREGGKPADVPTAFKLATERVRAEDEAARLPRAQVYGPRR